MPYNPGVQDISGQLYAQGINSAGNSIADMIDQWHKKTEEDKDMMAKARATKSFINTHPEMFGGEDEVKKITADNPNESPRQQYMKQGQMVQDALVNNKLQAENAQRDAALMQQREMQAKLDAFNTDRAQQLAAQQHLRTLSQFSQGIGNGVYAPQAQQQMSQQLYGTDSPESVAPGETAMARDQPPGGSQSLRRAVEMFGATGQVPSGRDLMADDTRQARIDASTDIATTRADARKQIEAAKIAEDKAKLEAKNAPPKFTQHPETGIWMMTQNGQTQALPGQVAKDPTLLEIDRMEKAGDLTHAEAVDRKKKHIDHKAEFSPNGMQQMMQMLRPDVFGTPGAPGTPGVGGASGEPATPQALLEAVRAGKVTSVEAKAIAQRKGWK